jgi:hypothetical protein
MSVMSPLARILLGILHKGTWAAGALLILFAGIFLAQRWSAGGFVFKTGDVGFLGILTVLLALAIYLVRGIKRELDKPGG